jgi:vacuolar-type H+-ATPase catalytic subunit A/Vma1
LAQSAYSPVDASSPIEKTYRLAKLGIQLYRSAVAALAAGTTFSAMDFPGARRALAAVRDATAEQSDERVKEAESFLATISRGERRP